MKRRKYEELKAFEKWLRSNGAEVLSVTNEWEIIRFRGNGTTSIIYRNKTGARTYTGQSREAWDAWAGGRSMRFTKATTRAKAGGDAINATLLERDGPRCFYCSTEFSEAVKPTREHLVSVTHGGPNHIANLFLACQPCNLKAGHLSAPEKIKLRDSMRRKAARSSSGSEQGASITKVAGSNPAEQAIHIAEGQ